MGAWRIRSLAATVERAPVSSRSMAPFLPTLFILLSPNAANAADLPLPKLYVVLATPASVKRPAGVEDQLTQVADRTEKFLTTWMKYWGYPPAQEVIFERTADHKVRVLYLEGKEPIDSYRKPSRSFAAEVWSTVVSKYNLQRSRHVWWVWVYLGRPDDQMDAWGGFGDSINGGVAWVDYKNLPVDIKIDDELGNPAPYKIGLKTCIHELGHAFGLPHDGPLTRLDLGVPLMGATIANFRQRTVREEERAYVSAASAAILWKHPIFSGTVERRDQMPMCRVSGLSLDNDTQKEVVHVTGQLQASIPAHSAVVFDSAAPEQETYWQKSYVAPLDEKGRFDVTITEPTRRRGTLRVVFCFENGIVTGDGRNHGISGAIEVPYIGSQTGYRRSH